MNKNALLAIAAQFSAYDVRFSEDGDRFEIINPYGKESIFVADEGKEAYTAYYVGFSCFHIHPYTAEHVITCVRDILEGKRSVIEFYKNGRVAMSTDIDTREMREVTCETLAARMGCNGESQMRFYADYADSFKIRIWGEDTDVDAIFIRDKQGNAGIQIMGTSAIRFETKKRRR
jgi:hypothetical protein